MNFKIWLENSEPDLSYLLLPKGQVPQIGLEKGRSKKNGIAKYKSPNGSYRYVLTVNNTIISALQIVSQDGIIGYVANVFTDKNFRRRGLARKLLDEAKKDFKGIEHSKHLSELGKLWIKGTES